MDLRRNKEICNALIMSTAFLISLFYTDAFAQFETVKTQGKTMLVQVFDLIKWFGLVLGLVAGGLTALKLMNEHEDKMEVLKKLAWIPIAILILFAIPALIKLVTGQNPLE
jgi:hypothetical protein